MTTFIILAVLLLLAIPAILIAFFLTDDNGDN